jgi:hypothetical protein
LLLLRRLRCSLLLPLGGIPRIDLLLLRGLRGPLLRLLMIVGGDAGPGFSASFTSR